MVLKKYLNGDIKRMITQRKIDEVAILWSKTKNPKYKQQWYQLVRSLYGSDNTKRWNVHSNSSDKTNDERCNVIWPAKFFRYL